MKYRTFRDGVLLGLGGAGLVAYFAIKHAQNPGPAPGPVPAPAPVPGPVQDGPDPDSEPLRDLDRRILAEIVGKPLSSAKAKDAYPSSRERVAVYADDGSSTPTRIKIDLDRDGKFDEKWELDRSTVTKRLVSTRDDEVYDEVFQLSGDRWIRTKSGLTAPPPPPRPPAPQAARTPLRDIDRKVLILLGQKATADKLKDALGKNGPKVNVYANGGSTVWNHAKIDFERNDKWNEKWDWKDGKVIRQVAPKDDEVYSQKFKLDGDSWVEKTD